MGHTCCMRKKSNDFMRFKVYVVSWHSQGRIGHRKEKTGQKIPH